MPLSLNEIKDRALAFSRDWEGEKVERAEAQTFWNEFFNVFGVTRRRIATFEEPVKKLPLFDEQTSKAGRIDLFWRGMLIAEHKSRGKDLDKAYKQSLDYFARLPERDLPRYVIVSDFARIRLYDLDTATQDEFPLKDFYKNIKLFGFIAGYTTQRIEAQDPVNIKAAERMGKLHDKLRASGYEGHTLEALLVRLLFCLFAEDTTLFEPRGSFRDFIEDCTREDGADLGPQLSLLFQVLDTREDRRQKNLDEAISVFPYVNGRLFAETLPIPTCDRAMRDILLDCCGLDWGRISPAIFGALFQCVMDEEGTARRRNLGAHYTSEENILKLIKPLFLDDLWAEFHAAKRSKTKLFELHKKISKLKFLDPACGCGNFLVIAYRELRLLELEILRAARDTGQTHLDIFQLVQIDVDQFYGIEIEEFPAQIAQVALWLTDHQMNMKVSEEFGQYFRRLPLVHAPNIVCGNALRMDWNDVISVYDVDFILGNPPFVGAMLMTKEQHQDLLGVLKSDLKGAGILDYVTAWYLKAVEYVRDDKSLSFPQAERAGNLSEKKDSGQAGMTGNKNLLNLIPGRAPREHVKIAFVSTNSITQGEQVGVLWSELLRLGVKLHFAHRTFRWSNEARGMAAVHCVIIGFGLQDIQRKTIYDYPDINSEPHALVASNINPYLVDAHDILLVNRSKPIVDVPLMKFGSMPRDGGNLIFTNEEKNAFLKLEPKAEKWIRLYMGSQEFINGEQRWCLWLLGIKPDELRAMPHVMKRIEAVRKFRLSSKAATTQKFAETPTSFCQIAQPESDYLLVPGVSSERRPYIPIGFMPSDVIANNLVFAVPQASLFHLGVLSSAMHMAWVRHVCGRLESRYRYSKDIVYNNFPWPSEPTEKQKQSIEEAAQGVLDARTAHPGSSLADLYDPIAMPPNLRQAHQTLDKAVDAAYGKKIFASDAERVAFLFELYHKYTSLLPSPEKRKKTDSKRGISRTKKNPLPDGGSIAISSDTWQNKNKEQNHDKVADKKNPARPRTVAEKPRQYELPEEGVSGEDTGLGSKVHGVREGAGEYNPPESSSGGGEGSTRPVDSTRYLETAQGLKSYSAVAEILAVSVAKTIESLITKNPDDIDITPEWICKLHGHIVDSLFPDWAGKFRNVDVQVGSHQPPPYFEVPAHMRLYCEDLSVRLSDASGHPVIEKIAETLAFVDWRFQWVHPFKDFNGRVGRIVLSAVLFKLKLPPAETASVDPAGKKRYLTALHAADAGDLSTLADIWIERLSRALIEE